MRALTIAALILVVGCGGDRAEQAAPPEATDTAPPRVAGPPPLQLAPAEGPPGTQVEMSIGGLVIRARVEVGFGDFGGHQILTTGEGDTEGLYRATVTVPAATAPGEYFFFLAEEGTARPLSAPTPFRVTAP